jgi:hypothetical protein
MEEMSFKVAITETLKPCLLGALLMAAACGEEGGGPQRGTQKDMSVESEPVSGEPPTILDDQEYAEAKRRAILGDLYAATNLIGHIEYHALTSGKELTDGAKRDRALGYEVMALHGICDSAADVMRDNSISRYISVDRIDRIREISQKCAGRHGYIDPSNGEHSMLPNQAELDKLW